MIVKNEGHILQRCLDSVSFISHLVICDTGSTDNTISVIEHWLHEHPHIHGKIVHEEWKNFGHNRQLAIDHAKKFIQCSDDIYLLFLDADMVLNIHDTFLTELSHADVWSFYQDLHSLQYLNIRCVRSTIDIQCRGVTHEYYQVPVDATKSHFPSSKVLIQDIGDGGCKMTKFERDVKLLKKGLEEEPENTRYMFYLANSLRDLGRYHEAIEYYSQHLSVLHTWSEERYCAMVYMGDCWNALNDTKEKLYCWIQSINLCPERLEGLFRCIRHFRSQKQYKVAWMYLEMAQRILDYGKWKQCVLFLEMNIYTFQLYEEMSIIAYYVGEYEKGLSACQKLSAFSHLPSSSKHFLLQNQEFYLHRMK